MKRLSQHLTVCCSFNVRPAVFWPSLGLQFVFALNIGGKGKKTHTKPKNPQNKQTNKTRKKPQNGTMQLKYKDIKNQAEEDNLTTEFLSLKFRIAALSLTQRNTLPPPFVGRPWKTLGSRTKNPHVLRTTVLLPALATCLPSSSNRLLLGSISSPGPAVDFTPGFKLATWLQLWQGNQAPY